ncbi:MAG: DUF2339 domain-containing protein [Planctomycetota bacterium]
MPRVAVEWTASGRIPFLNWQMGLALAIAAAGWWEFRVMVARARGATGTGGVAGASGLPSLASAPQWQWIVASTATFLLVALSFQIDVAVVQLAAAGRTLGHTEAHLRQLLFTLLWTLGALAVVLIALANTLRTECGRPGGAGVLLTFAWVVIGAAAVKWVLIDSLVLGFLAGAASRVGALPLANVQLLTGLLLAVGATLMLKLTGLGRAAAVDAESDRWVRAARLVPVAAALLVLWAASLEVLRVIELAERSGRVSVWNPPQVRALWLTLLWAAGAILMLLYGRWRPWRPMFAAGWTILLGAALVWLIVDTLFWRLEVGVRLAVPFANLQFAAGAALLALIGVAAWRTGRPARPDAFVANVRVTAAAVSVAIGLWLGTLELDRILAPEAGRVADAVMARHTAWSIYWGVYGIGLVVLGFARRVAWLRYTGLALLAATLAKVLIVDMARVQYLYRVLSLLATGLLCMGTSIAYGKLAQRLLAEPKARAAGSEWLEAVQE